MLILQGRLSRLLMYDFGSGRFELNAHYSRHLTCDTVREALWVSYGT